MSEEAVRTISELCAAAFGVLFLGAGAAKLEGIKGWADLIRRFPLPPSLRVAAFFGVPVAEMGVGVLSFVWPALGLAACSLLLLVFAAASARYFRSIRGAECRCFGNLAASKIDVRLIGRNVVLGAVATGAAGAAWATKAEAVPVLWVAPLGVLALILFLISEYRAMPKVGGIGDLHAPAGGMQSDG